MDQLKPCSANSVPLTPLNFLERAALVYGDCTSIIYNATTYTWSQTQERCLRLASSLSSLGITRGDVVSIVAPNTPAMYEAHFGVPMCGAVLNTMNTRLDARMLSVHLLHGEAKLAIVDYQFLQVVTEAMALVSAQSGKQPMVVLIGKEDADDDGSALKINGLQIIATYEELIMRGDPLFKWVRPTSDWEPIVLNYTSGTTSEPKGVVHCHRSLFLSALDALVIWGVAGRPVYLWTLPMFHANGWSFPWAMAAVGGTNVCLRRFDSSVIHSAISDHKVTHMCGAPVVLNMIANHAYSIPAGQKRVEVESVIYGHPAVDEAAVVARPDKYWGETPCAFLSLKREYQGRTSEKEIIAFCREKLPHYMVPKTVVFGELPKTSTGKTQKAVLRQKAKALGSLSHGSVLQTRM
ncbi:putative acyl-activating enzyme 6 [Nymphaea thermarum]|nr:putative acyl-activating enzyme 6 [Nymphaea thermarum]